MNTLFTYILDNNLTKELLMDLMVQGVNIDEIDEEVGTTPLLFAYNEGNDDAVYVLLECGADSNVPDEDGTTILLAACRTHNMQMIWYVLQHQAQLNAVQVQKIRANPEKYDPEYMDSVMYQENALDNNREIDVRETIKKLITQDDILQKYPALLTVIESVTSLDYAIDLTGGYSSDKIEATVCELTIDSTEHFFEYFYFYNASYEEVHCMFGWHVNNHKTLVWDIADESGPFTDEQQAALSSLADAFNLKDVPAEHFMRFMVILLSRMVQKNWIKIEEHGIYLRFK